MLLNSLIWQAPAALCAGTLPVHATFQHFDSEKEALDCAGTACRGPYCVSLNGTWKFHYYETPEAVAESDLDCDCVTWDEIKVPGAWTMQGYDRPHYTNIKMPYKELPPNVPEQNPTGLYRRDFTVPSAWKDRRIILRFDGVESCFAVRVNGHDIGFAKNSRGTHEFDITQHCKTGVNSLAVLVLKWSDANFIEDQDMWWHGGIVRDVLLLSRPISHIADIFAKARLKDDCRTGHLDFSFAVDYAPLGKIDADWRMRLNLFAPDGALVPGFPMECATGCISSKGGYIPSYDDIRRIQCDLPDVLAWSAEHPNLYKLSAALLDGEGRLVDATAIRIGFRRMEIKERKLLINGEPVQIHGVNRHEANPHTGRTISRADMERDLKMMKRFNINAIRTSHYPDAPDFYDLCDEYGFYVWDEANLEHHAFYSSICRNPAWTPAYAERVTHLLERDKNHPSVIVWSLGNEAGQGANHAAMAGYIRFRDGTRPINYEGAIHANGYNTVPNRNLCLTDIVGPMYPPVSKIREWSRIAKDDSRPYIMCEYSHAMGNSNGELKDYFKAFDECEGLQGGFIWEWCDHSLYKKDKDGREYLAYGGDFGDVPNDGNFVCDGLVGAERDVHPGLYEYKYLSQPVRFHALDLSKLAFELENRQYFSDWSAFALKCTFLVDGVVVATEDMQMPEIAPRFGARASVAPKCPEWSKFQGKRAHINFQVLLKNDSFYAEAGFEVAHWQFELPVRLPKVVCAVKKKDGISVVPGKNGNVMQLLLPGGIAIEGPEPCFWRAPTDNDGFKLPQLNNDCRPIQAWFEKGYDRFSCTDVDTKCKDGNIEVKQTIAAPGIQDAVILHRMKVLALDDGAVCFENTFTVPEEYQDLPRVGLLWKVPLSFDRLEYLGLGPYENYRDRDAAAMFGRFAMPIKDLPGSYLMPQSAGNRTQVQELVLQGAGNALHVIAQDAPFEFSLLPYSDAELFAARHWHELGQQRCWYWHLDAMQRGVGTRSCGPVLQECYQIASGEYKLNIMISL